MLRVLLVPLLLSTLLAGGCAAPGPGGRVAAVMDGDPARPADSHWLRTELYLALGRAEDPEGPRIDASVWRAFLDEEVTPRFPDGFSVIDAYGQWRGRESGHVGRLESRVIVILHPDTPRARDGVEEIRRAFKRRFDQDSVLRATAPVEVSF